MKLVLTLLTLAIVSFSCSPLRNSKNCNAFKKGRFFFHAETNNQAYFITRDDSIQYETSLSDGSVSKWRIKWLSDCTYELWFLPEAPISRRDSFFMNSPVLTDILSTTREYYIFRCRRQATGFDATDTMFRRK